MMKEHEISEIENQLSAIDDAETREFAMNFVCAVSDFVKETEGRLVRALVNGDKGEITGDEFWRYVKTLPVNTYISIFKKMYADMKKYHPIELKSLESNEKT